MRMGRVPAASKVCRRSLLSLWWVAARSAFLRPRARPRRGEALRCPVLAYSKKFGLPFVRRSSTPRTEATSRNHTAPDIREAAPHLC